MLLLIENAELTEQEPEFAAAVLARTFRHTPRAERITVLCSPRVPLDAEPHKNPGWIEWAIQIVFVDGGRLYIGAIQRRPGMDVEFHG